MLYRVLGMCCFGLVAMGAEQVDSNFDQAFNVKTGAGYKDNVLLSKFADEQSAFWQSTLSYFLFGTPSDGLDVILSLDFTDRRYFSAPTVDKEQDASAYGSAVLARGDWKYGVEGSYLYLDNVVDVSTDNVDLLSLQVKTHTINAYPFAEYAFNPTWRLRFGPQVTREFSEELEHNTEIGPMISLVGTPWSGGELEFRYDYHWRLYDAREGVDLNFEAHPEKKLHFQQHEFETRWSQKWGEAQAWRTRIRLGYERNEDNAFGTYDYHKLRMATRFGFHVEKWSATVEGKVLHYMYDSQRVGGPGSDEWRRTSYTITSRFERNVWRTLKVFAESEHEWSVSNDPAIEYQVNTIWSGVDWEF